MYSSRSASAAVPASASGRSAKSCAITSGDLRYRSALRASRRPAASSVVWWWTQVSTSNSGRSPGVAKRTPLVATTGTRKRVRQLGQRLVVGFLVAQQMPLQLDADVVAAEEADEPIEQAADAVLPRVEHRPARQRDEAGGEAVELLERERALPFRRAHLHARHQAAEVPVALCDGDEDGQPP